MFHSLTFTFLLTAIMLFSSLYSVAQTPAAPAAPAASQDDGKPEVIDSKYFKVGVGVGYNGNFSKLYDASLSPADYSLKLQPVARGAFVISSAVIFNPSFVYREVDINGLPYGEAYTAASAFSLIATLNMAEFSPSEGTLSFNKKIDGGLGLGFRIGKPHMDNLNDQKQNDQKQNDQEQSKKPLNDASSPFHIGIFLDVSSYRQLRDNIVADYTGKPIPINGSAASATPTYLNALDQSDNSLFYSKTIFGLSVKFIYILGGN